jgi:hypothetical protein
MQDESPRRCARPLWTIVVTKGVDADSPRYNLSGAAISGLMVFRTSAAARLRIAERPRAWSGGWHSRLEVAGG